MPPSSAAAPLRTWTTHDQNPSAKWILVFWLGLALFILLATFFWWLSLPRNPRTFYVSMVIEDYGDLLPQPYYPVWPSGEIKQLQETRQIDPWHSFEEEELQSFDNLETSLNDLPDKLKKNAISTQDTLIMQLRLHCKVSQGDDRRLNVSLLAGEKSGELSGENFLKALSRVPAKNVIVLADVCDLDYAPQIGVVVNPIASGLKQLCERTKFEGGPNIWIVCAARDLDANYVSHLRQRTLLQSACEFALSKDSNETDSSDSTLSLTEFYQQVWRYCRRASEIPSSNPNSPGPAAQLPVLMHVGDAQLCDPSATNSWNLASKVHVASFHNKSSGPTEKEPNEPKKETSDDAPASIAKPAKADPVLSYWEIRDELSSIGSPWPPALFAPHHWQEHQQRMARRQFHSDADEQAKKATDELKKLLDEMKTPSTSTDVEISQPLLSSYREFKRAAQFDAARQTWLRDDYIAQPANDWKNWKLKVRNYAKTCADLPAWAAWYRHDLAHVTQFTELATSIVELHGSLPKNDKGILDEVTTFDITKLDACRSELHELFEEQIDKLNKSFAKKKPQLTWHDEHQLQRLMESPLLDSAKRTELWLKWRKFQEDEPLTHAIGPGESYQQTDRRENLVADTGGFEPAIDIWTDAVARLGQLVNIQGVHLKSNWLAGTKSNWHEFEETVYRASPPNSFPQDERLHAWHVRCLAGLLRNRPEAAFSAGIVLPASRSRTLQVNARPAGEVRFGEKYTADLTLIAFYPDTTLVDEVWLSWPDNTANALATQYLTISHAGGTLGTEPVRVKVNTDKTIGLKLTYSDPKQLLKTRLEIELLVSEKKNTVGLPIPLTIVPTQPDTVEVVVQRVIGPEVSNLVMDKSDDYPILDCVAAEGAKSRYRFALVNRSSQAKRCKVTLHPLPLDVFANGRPTTDDSALRDLRQAWPAVAEKIVEMPAGDVGNDRPIRVEFGPAPSAVAAAATAVIPEYGWFYFHMQEVDADNKDKVKSHARFCRLEGLNPVTARLLAIEPRIEKGGYRLTLQTNQGAWDENSLTSLSVRAEVEPFDRRLVRDFTLEKDSNYPLTWPLESEDVRKFYLHVGGYPRATAYASDNTRGPVAPSSVQILSVQGLTRNKDNPVVIADEEGVFPALDAQQQIIDYVGVKFNAKIDMRDYSIQLVDSSSLPAGELRGKTRRMTFNWERTESGDLWLSAIASDIEGKFKLDNPSGSYTLKIKTSDARTLHEYPLPVFDQDKPEPVEFSYEKQRVEQPFVIEITRGQKLEFQVTARDRGAAGIKKLQLAVNSPTDAKPVFDEGDTPLTKLSKNQKDTWTCTVDDSVYKDYREFTIVVSSEDFARNVQKSHPALKVRVKPAPKPPKPADQAK